MAFPHSCVDHVASFTYTRSDQYVPPEASLQAIVSVDIMFDRLENEGLQLPCVDVRVGVVGFFCVPLWPGSIEESI